MTIAIAIYGCLCIALGVAIGNRIGKHTIIKQMEPLLKELKENADILLICSKNIEKGKKQCSNTKK